MTQSEQLSGAALNHAIAERLGWRIEKAGTRYIVTDPQGKQEAYQKKAWAEAYILRRVPDWANNVGYALALCERMARERNLSFSLWSDRNIGIRKSETGVMFSVNNPRSAADIEPVICAFKPGDITSLTTALARLALAALTQEAHE